MRACVCVCAHLGVVEGSNDMPEPVGVNLKAAEQRHQQDTTHTSHIDLSREGGGGGHAL